MVFHYFFTFSNIINNNLWFNWLKFNSVFLNIPSRKFTKIVHCYLKPPFSDLCCRLVESTGKWKIGLGIVCLMDIRQGLHPDRFLTGSDFFHSGLNGIFIFCPIDHRRRGYTLHEETWESKFRRCPKPVMVHCLYHIFPSNTFSMPYVFTWEWLKALIQNMPSVSHNSFHWNHWFGKIYDTIHGLWLWNPLLNVFGNIKITSFCQPGSHQDCLFNTSNVSSLFYCPSLAHGSVLKTCNIKVLEQASRALLDASGHKYNITKAPISGDKEFLYVMWTYSKTPTNYFRKLTFFNFCELIMTEPKPARIVL